MADGAVLANVDGASGIGVEAAVSSKIGVGPQLDGAVSVEEDAFSVELEGGINLIAFSVLGVAIFPFGVEEEVSEGGDEAVDKEDSQEGIH